MSVGVVEMWQSCQSGSGCSNGTGAVRPEQVRDRESIGQRIGARKRASLARTGARLSGASRSGAKHIPNATVEYPGGVNRDHIYEPTRSQKQSRTMIHQGSHSRNAIHTQVDRETIHRARLECLPNEAIELPTDTTRGNPEEPTQRKRNQRRPTRRDRTPSLPFGPCSRVSEIDESDPPDHGHTREAARA